jgi:hypothetical protein
MAILRQDKPPGPTLFKPDTPIRTSVESTGPTGRDVRPLYRTGRRSGARSARGSKSRMVRHRSGGSARINPCLTMREQIIIRISLRDDVPLRWPSCEDYSARSSLPSKQRVAGSNPAGRAGKVFTFERGLSSRLSLAFPGAVWRIPGLLPFGGVLCTRGGFLCAGAGFRACWRLVSGIVVVTAGPCAWPGWC